MFSWCLFYCYSWAPFTKFSRVPIIISHFILADSTAKTYRCMHRNALRNMTCINQASRPLHTAPDKWHVLFANVPRLNESYVVYRQAIRALDSAIILLARCFGCNSRLSGCRCNGLFFKTYRTYHIILSTLGSWKCTNAGRGIYTSLIYFTHLKACSSFKKWVPTLKPLGAIPFIFFSICLWYHVGRIEIHFNICSKRDCRIDSLFNIY